MESSRELNLTGLPKENLNETLGKLQGRAESREEKCWRLQEKWF